MSLEELDKLIKAENIAREIKSRVAWLGHSERMEEHWPIRKIADWKFITCRPIVTSKMEWEGDIKLKS
jgi:hypothetical protein